ncbi:hypothetical protein WMY93_031951 [Mugilogobius chulae]|uniref:Uncharacterized protein n=1 Tax=Mugilogobius chulae TaxID=88201 RepID=A0AAW0MF00_9GOBI
MKSRPNLQGPEKRWGQDQSSRIQRGDEVKTKPPGPGEEMRQDQTSSAQIRDEVKINPPGPREEMRSRSNLQAQRRDEVKTKPPGPMSQSPAATADHSSWCRGSSKETLENLKVMRKLR